MWFQTEPSLKRPVGPFVSDKKGQQASGARPPVSWPLTIKHFKAWVFQLDKPDVTRVWSQLTRPCVQSRPAIFAPRTETLQNVLFFFYTRWSWNSLWRKCDFCEIAAHVRGQTTEPVDVFDGCDSRGKCQDVLLFNCNNSRQFFSSSKHFLQRPLWSRSLSLS